MYDFSSFVVVLLLLGAAGSLAGAAISVFFAVGGGIRPLKRIVNDVEADLAALTVRFGKDQKRRAAEISAEVRSGNKIPKELEALIYANAPVNDTTPSGIEYVGQ